MKKIHSQNSGRESEASILGNDREREFPLTPAVTSLYINTFEKYRYRYRYRYGEVENIDIDIDIDRAILKNIDIDIDIDKAIPKISISISISIW